ncbi:histidine kinase [Paenibacillus albidus]|uniref:sensor histidine kinase n=1 Tax=Paenibacillus albidus TaxID=2041023 RepID=UPI001BEBF97F|nr:histidine kinase [Paenibacillus albidus]MBT2287614.1 histidine kinase [Paenibacillus albidus]
MYRTFKSRFSSRSLRFRIIGSVSIVIFILILLMIINNLYAIRIVRSQVFESNKNTLNIYMKQMDDAFSDVENFLAGMSSTDVNIKSIEMPARDIDRYLAQYRAERLLKNSIWSYKMIDGFFVYSNPAQIYIDAVQNDINAGDRLRIKNYIAQRFSDVHTAGLSRSSWTPVEIGGDFYLFRVIKVWNSSVGAWVKVNDLIEPLQGKHFSGVNHLFLTNEDGRPLLADQFLDGRIINLNKNMDEYHLTNDGRNKYLVIAQHSKHGEFSMVALIRDNNILDGLDSLQKSIAVIALCVIVILLSLTFMLRKLVIAPLNDLRLAMKMLKSGNFDVKIKSKNLCDEFVMVNHTFEDMTSQIKRLKIDVYEEKILKQRAELQYLQLQLNPHFFMNCLSVIHSLAGLSKTTLIQDMTVNLRNYLRYALEGDHLVTLEKEIEHVKTYLDIQRLRFPDSLICKFDIDAKTVDALVPPLIIQTFTENALKHEAVAGETFCISIAASVWSDALAPKLRLVIIDSGDGFQDPILRILQEGRKISDVNGQHIGIHNIQQRLTLIYGDQTRIEFSNEPGSGARVDIEIPLQQHEAKAVLTS